MSEKLTFEIIEADYPEMFKLCCDFSNPPAWKDTLIKLFANIAAELKDGEIFNVQQIKEKFGGLRVYYDFNDEVGEPTVSEDTAHAVAVLVYSAEADVLKMCGTCGTGLDPDFKPVSWGARTCGKCNDDRRQAQARRNDAWKATEEREDDSRHRLADSKVKLPK